MNYIDTSTCYGGSEDIIGRALRDVPSMRDKLILATKWDPGHNTPKEEMLKSLDSSLRRLGVGTIDIMQVHWLGGGHTRPDDGFNRLDNPALYEAMETAKKAGKVRFFGATSHDANRSKILQHAVDKGFDMLLVKMNVLDFETADMPALLKKAKEKDVGVVVMKSQPGGGKIPAGFERSKLNIYQANLKWCLAQDIACVVHSAIGTDAGAQDLATGASLDALGAGDAALLEEYASALSPEYCRGCRACEAECPEGVAITEAVQFAMYEKRYGWSAYAKELYRALPEKDRWAEACLSCDRCTSACPHGFDAAAEVNEARRLLAT
jgi:predicted aldo/keto reductase-like oxidoreductase